MKISNLKKLQLLKNGVSVQVAQPSSVYSTIIYKNANILCECEYS